MSAAFLVLRSTHLGQSCASSFFRDALAGRHLLRPRASSCFTASLIMEEALHANTLPFINGGRGVEWVPNISSQVGIAVIVVTLA